MASFPLIEQNQIFNLKKPFRSIPKFPKKFQPSSRSGFTAQALTTQAAIRVACFLGRMNFRNILFLFFFFFFFSFLFFFFLPFFSFYVGYLTVLLFSICNSSPSLNFTNGKRYNFLANSKFHLSIDKRQTFWTIRISPTKTAFYFP